MKNYQNKKGFTLIELLVVVAIISLLASVVMASLSSARVKAKDSGTFQALVQMRNALELYRSSFGKYPYEGENQTFQSDSTAFNDFVTDTLVNNKFMSQVPSKPGGDSDSSNNYYIYFTRDNFNVSGDVRTCGQQKVTNYVIGVYSTRALTGIPKFTRISCSASGCDANYYCITS